MLARCDFPRGTEVESEIKYGAALAWGWPENKRRTSWRHSTSIAGNRTAFVSQSSRPSRWENVPRPMMVVTAMEELPK